MRRKGLRGGCGYMGKAALAFAAIMMMGNRSHAETEGDPSQRQRRQEILHLITGGSFAHNKCKNYIVDAQKIIRISRDSGVEEVIKASKEDAEFSFAQYKKLESGVLKEVCSEIYRQYGKSGTIIKDIISKR